MMPFHSYTARICHNTLQTKGSFILFPASLVFILSVSLFQVPGQNMDAPQPVHGPTPVVHRPSIILLQFHGLAFGDLSCLGQTQFQTPNFDELAGEGMTFTHFTPGTTNPAEAQARFLNCVSYSDQTMPLASILKSAGYRTGFIGEWPLPGQPWDQGFDEFAGFLNPDLGTNYYADTFWRRTPKMFYNNMTHNWMEWNPADGPNNGGQEMIYQNIQGHQGRYLPDFMFTWVLHFMQDNMPQWYTGYRPFFLVVNLPAPRSAAPGKDVFPVPTDAPFSDEPWPQPAKNRAALLTRLDGSIATLLQKLRQKGLTNEVAVFLTSSEPPAPYSTPGMGFLQAPEDRANTTNSAPLAPMITYWPGVIPAGKTNNQPWQASDFPATALQIAGCKPVGKISGTSIIPLLQGHDRPSQP